MLIICFLSLGQQFELNKLNKRDDSVKKSAFVFLTSLNVKFHHEAAVYISSCV